MRGERRSVRTLIKTSRIVVVAVSARRAARTTIFFDQGVGSWTAVGSVAFDPMVPVANQLCAVQVPFLVENGKNGTFPGVQAGLMDWERNENDASLTADLFDSLGWGYK
ncbi:hypothetical protein JQ615_25375 [Bradyrhizobium jicamae]|uniref:Uncharacterized protein n=1 Tax=Bradyrhizobium jicamae TaxID=280332 RepID=A0ABS5FPL2_9BRAD|nr:hypothetical protein [Bradyrhizobium jicamae]MBR0798723.1 hypothetical protein [Bradyrhizobium jicamae]